MSDRSDRKLEVVVEFDEFLERRIASAPIEWIDEQLKARNLDYTPLLQNVRATIAGRNVEATTHDGQQSPSWGRLAAAVLLGAFLLLMSGERRNTELRKQPLVADRMSFDLRILFSGLMAFVPSADGEELTVVLLNDARVPALGGVPRTNHQPLMLARAGSCEPACPKSDTRLSQLLFMDLSPERATDALEGAIAGGGAWQLSGSDLSLVPTTSKERADFRWTSNLVDLNDDVLQLGSNSPLSNLVAARLHLRTGKCFTYSVSRIEARPHSMYSQALAAWMAADIQLPGDVVEIVERDRIHRTTRSMRLRPRNGLVELAVVNLPPLVPSTTRPAGSQSPGMHFETYYDIAETPPQKPPK